MTDFGRNALFPLGLLVVVLFGTSAYGQSPGAIACGELRNGYGPFDYRTADSGKRNLVEGAHFTANVETLQKGNTGPLGGEIDYTLRAFPNHVRALAAMERLSRKQGERPPGTHWPVACYFDRAIRFAPDDGAVRAVFAIYLANKNANKEALAQLELARQLVGDDPNINYNMGLVYFDLKQYDRALEYAHKAYSGGFPLPGLRNLLVRAGKWRDPEPQAATGQGERAKP